MKSAIPIYTLLTLFINISCTLNAMEQPLTLKPTQNPKNSHGISIVYLDVIENSKKKFIPKFPKRDSISLIPQITLTPPCPELRLVSQESSCELKSQDVKNNFVAKQENNVNNKSFMPENNIPEAISKSPCLKIKNHSQIHFKVVDEINSLISDSNLIKNKEEKLKKVEEIILTVKEILKDYPADSDAKKYLEELIDDLKNRNK